MMGCNKEEEIVITGTLSGTITEFLSDNIISGAIVTLYNADDNSPAGYQTTSDESGRYSFEIEPASYYIKVAQQGYNNTPADGVSPVPFTIDLGVTFTFDIEMT